jgi:hypothetical protein
MITSAPFKQLDCMKINVETTYKQVFIFEAEHNLNTF